MTKNQFLTDANAYLEAISPNYAKSTMDEKSRKLRYYAMVLHALQMEGRIKSNSPSKLTADDLHTYVTFRRSMGVKDTTIAKDLSIIGMFLRWKGNDAKEIYECTVRQQEAARVQREAGAAVGRRYRESVLPGEGDRQLAGPGGVCGDHPRMRRRIETAGVEAVVRQ